MRVALTFRGWVLRLLLLLGILLAAGVTGLLFGAESLSPRELFGGDERSRFILSHLRLPLISGELRTIVIQPLAEF